MFFYTAAIDSDQSKNDLRHLNGHVVDAEVKTVQRNVENKTVVKSRSIDAMDKVNVDTKLALAYWVNKHEAEVFHEMERAEKVVGRYRNGK